MPADHQILGALGEKLAISALRENSYTILEKNYRCKIGEIDIVARHGSYLVFIEVKTRSSHRFGNPAAAITAEKQQRIVRVAQFYLSEKQLGDCDIRFDVVTVVGKTPKKSSVTILEDAFYCQ